MITTRTTTNITTKKRKRRNRLTRSSLAAGVVFLALAAGLIPIPGHGYFPQAQAQNLGQRVVSGSVVDESSALVSGATVFLRNAKTKSIRSYTSSKDGRFRFAQVSMSDDFDLWAEKEGRKSAVKPVSSWDARKEFETELRLK
jgi:Carboxypeptidase regulatory-like domain